MPRSPVSPGMGQGMGQESTRQMGQEMAQGVGFYGKLPHLGDFVARRLPPDFVRPWDLWLQESLAASRAQLGDDWLGIYLTSPLWRFVLTAGIAGQTPWAGVLMPSVDRVGRYFPLTLACPLGEGVEPLLLLGETGWYERLERVLLTSLDESSTLATFDNLVQGLEVPAPPGPSLPHPGPPGQARTNAWRLPASSPLELQGCCAGLLSLALAQTFCAYSLWWTSGSERVSPSGLICQGLPPTDGFSGLLGGDWRGTGWWDLAPQPMAMAAAGSQ